MVDQIAVIKRLESNSSLLDVMIKVEDFFDTLDLYAYANWIDGVVVDGPWTSRYWVKLSLKYPYDKMPDPRGGMRLVKYDVKINFKVIEEQVPISLPNYTEPNNENNRPFDSEGKPKMKKIKVWIVTFKIPKRYVSSINLHNVNDSGLNIDDLSNDTDQLSTESAPSAAPAAPPAPEAASDTGLPSL